MNKLQKHKKTRLLLLFLSFIASKSSLTKIRPTIFAARYEFDQSSNDDTLYHFRFDKNALRKLEELLNIPSRIVLPQRSVVLGFDAFLMLLKRFAYPIRLDDIAIMFGRPREIVSMTIKWMVNYIYKNFCYLLKFDQSRLTPQKLEYFAKCVYQKGAPLSTVYAFIDGTVRPNSRPGLGQKLFFNGHHRIHALKYQSVTTPDGIIVDLCGPFEGRRHDCFLLKESQLLIRMQEWSHGIDGSDLHIYGDPAYGVTRYLISPFKGASLTEKQNLFNSRMSSVRESVEYGFQRIITYCAFLDFKKNLKILLQPVGKMYHVGALLVNFHACFYGTQTATFFNVETPSIEEYILSANR